jgi:hypothetical protein
MLSPAIDVERLRGRRVLRLAFRDGLLLSESAEPADGSLWAYADAGAAAMRRPGR